jgi:hypothetical protein
VKGPDRALGHAQLRSPPPGRRRPSALGTRGPPR